MNIKKELDTLGNNDIYSLMLFTLYKSTEIPEYSSLSQLAYLIDKDSLLKLCEFYGGLTIKIPTLDELEVLLNALLIFQLVELDGKNIETITSKFNNDSIDCFYKIREILKNYNFNSGRTNNDL